MPYKKWKKYNDGEESLSLLNTAIGCGGVMYPPRWYGDTLFNLDKAMSLCPLADDLWLKANQLERGVAVAFPGGYFPKPLELPGTKRSALQRRNNGHTNMNDEQWRRLDREFGLAAMASGAAHGEKTTERPQTPK